MKENLFIDATNENSFKENYKLIIKDSKKFKISYFNALQSNDLKIKEGEYYTINFSEEVLESDSKSLVKEITKIFSSLLKKYHSTYKTLIIGLGNNKLLGDNFGGLCLDKIIATNHYDFLTIPKVALFKPDVIANTGINSFKLIRMLINNIHPDIIVIIDSCITKDHCNLNNTIEINDVGIIRSNAISSNKEITKETFNIPIISILVPLIIKIDDNYYTKINTLEVSEKISEIVAQALNKLYFH